MLAAVITAARVDPSFAADPVNVAQNSLELQPYDAGYASKAATTCPGLTLIPKIDDETKATDSFKRGVAMFETLQKSMQLDGACKSALKLFHAETGKTAKILANRTPGAAPTPATPILTGAETATSGITSKSDGKRKINLSGRQRMLSQYMAKAVCFANLKVDAATQVNELRTAHHLFDQTLKDFRTGTTVQLMLPETDAGILAALDEVDKVWATYGAAVVNQELAPTTSLNTTVLAKANDAVTLFQQKYGSSGDVTPPVAAALNVSGRQRMLTQKSSKEFCLIATGVDTDANRKNLKTSVELYEKSMLGLKNGDKTMGLEAAPAPQIVDGIAKSYAEWTKIKVIFDRVINGSDPTNEDIATVSRQNVAIMEAANVVVELYEKHAQ